MEESATETPEPAILTAQQEQSVMGCGSVATVCPTTASWMEAVVGRDWEIFWNDDNEDDEGKMKDSSKAKDSYGGKTEKDNNKHSTPSGGDDDSETERMETDDDRENKEESDEEDEDTVHEDGWYIGRIIEFVRSDKDGQAIFQISYVGDDQMYEASLCEQQIRPCVQRWVIRSLTLLRAANPLSAETLSHDTSLPGDTEALASIRAELATALPTLTKELADVESTETLPPFTLETMQALQKLRCLVREQIYLRTRLGPVEEDESYEFETGCETMPPPPSEAYVNHLVDLLNQIQDACAWVEDAYRLLARVYGESSSSSGDDRVTRETIVEVGLAQGQSHVQNLLELDFMSSPSRRKRKNPPKPVAGKPASRRLQQRNKRQRIEALYQQSTKTEGGTSATTASPLLDLQSQDLWVSTDVVIQYLHRVVPDDAPWYLSACADMLRAISSHLVEKYRDWTDKAESCLGKRNEKAPAISSEEVEPVDDSSTRSYEERREFVSYTSIASAIDAAESHPLFSRFDFSGFVPDLRQKLLHIDEFEVRTWREIGRVLEDVGFVDSESDPILLSLKGRLEISNDPTSKVGNVHPLGRPSTDLTREVIENAIVYRHWFLDLLYAESGRERLDFIENVVGRLSRLPPLQSSVVKSPSESAVDLSLTLDATAPRAHTLSRRALEHVVIFNRYKTAFNDRQGSAENHHWLRAKVDMDKAMSDFGKASVLSVSEEMAYCRTDVIGWLDKAEELLSAERPPFDMVKRVQDDLDALARGQSSTRAKVVKHLRSNPEIDSEIRRFILADLETFKEKYLIEVRRLFSVSRSWKDRYDSIAACLRAHGNKLLTMGEGESSVSKTAAMIDLKRMEDLLYEYRELPVSFETETKLLKEVCNSTRQWQNTVKEKLLGQIPVNLGDALTFVDTTNDDDVRPRGVIVHPTRQVLSTLAELLRWHQNVRLWVDSGSLHPRPYSLMLEGVEIIEGFSVSKQEKGWFAVSSERLTTLLSTKLSNHKSKRCLALHKLRSNPFTEAYVNRLFCDVDERSLGHPLGHLVFFSWEIEVEKFLEDMTLSPKGSRSLDEATRLVEGKPVFDCTLIDKVGHEPELVESPGRLLQNLVLVYREKESFIQEACTKSKSLQRDCIRNTKDIRSHFAALKDVQAFLKAPAQLLSIKRDLEVRLDRELKLFSWMTRALDYHVLRSEFPIEDSGHPYDAEDDGRIPWEVLIRLHESRPALEKEDTGGLACLVVRVRDLYQTASKWQEEISKLTQLSLRGVKRRESPAKGGRDDTDDTERVCLEKLTDMCRHEVLDKVAMPREAAVQSMLEYTAKFENMLHEFFGKDFEGDSADRAPYPRGASLVENGHFIIFRLIRGPLFGELKRIISEMSVLAENVLAETPGKATFDWVVKAVEWIESVGASFSRDKSGRLTLKVDIAETLVHTGESVLLDVPDDLKRTLSQHGIFVSTNKERKLTVKSLKKGAQYAVGATIIRWCPVLFDALKADLSRTQQWSDKFRNLADEYRLFQETDGDTEDEESVIKCHMYQQEMSDLEHEVPHLVVAPMESMVAYTKTFVDTLETYLKTHSSPELDKKAADLFFKDGKNVSRMRGALREALLGRLQSVGGTLAESSPDEKNSLPFRYAARTVLKETLNAVAEKLDLRMSSDTLASLCDLKAAEIESALYQRCPGNDDLRITPEYRQQARSLKRGLGDSGNIELFLKVLTGKVDAMTLVSMPPEKLANPQVRLERAKVEHAARQAVMLTKAAPNDSSDKEKPLASETSRIESDPKASFAKKDSSSGSNTPQSMTCQRDEGPAGGKILDNPTKPKSYASFTSSEKGEQSSISNKSHIVHKLRSGSPPPRPPPPPSLASFKPETDYTNQWAENTAGSQIFEFCVDSSRHHFSAGMLTEGRKQAPAVPLTEQFVEKGKAKADEIASWVKSKVSGRKWDFRLYQLSGDSLADEAEIEKMCSFYEKRHRLPMFAVDSVNKLFIVPPKLQSILKDVMQFEKPDLAYAFLFFRKN